MVSPAKWMDKGVRTLRNQKCGGHTAQVLADKRCASAAVLANSEACTLVALGCNIDMVALATASGRCSMATFGPSESIVATSESVEVERTDWDLVEE